jgi:hypothetical protein
MVGAGSNQLELAAPPVMDVRVEGKGVRQENIEAAWVRHLPY